MYSGVTFNDEIMISDEDVWLGNSIEHFKFLAVMRSVYDSSVYHEFCASANREKNSIILFMSHNDTACIQPGKYIFDIVSRSNTNSNINKIKEGVVYVYSSYGLEAYKKAQKEIL
jgi:hypothetical protein